MLMAALPGERMLRAQMAHIQITRSEMQLCRSPRRTNKESNEDADLPTSLTELRAFSLVPRCACVQRTKHFLDSNHPLFFYFLEALQRLPNSVRVLVLMISKEHTS